MYPWGVDIIRWNFLIYSDPSRQDNNKLIYTLLYQNIFILLKNTKKMF